MKTRSQIYGQEAKSLLRDITMYRALTREQVLRLYPDKKMKIEKILQILIRQNRIFQIGQYYCPAPECINNIDRGLLAAVWVLTDFMDQVEYHSIGDYPVKLIFYACDEIYEIVHAEQGKEALLSHILSDHGEQASKYLVLVDDPRQIE